MTSPINIRRNPKAPTFFFNRIKQIASQISNNEKDRAKHDGGKNCLRRVGPFERFSHKNILTTASKT